MSTNTILNNTNQDTNQVVTKLLNPKTEKQLLLYLTDEMWQEIFTYLKENNIPSTEKKMKRTVNTRVVQRSWGLSDSGGYTLDEYYTDNINGTLDIMRGKYNDEGVIGIVYHGWQIKDLLKYEPNMQSRLCNDDGFVYFECWL